MKRTPPVKKKGFMNGQIEVIPTERNVTETFHCRGTELSALLAQLREEGAVLLCLSIECQSDFTLTVRRNNFSAMTPREQNKG
ncbi:MAG: hypothetical protein O2960_27900 [Verrucomicrobia bacterium]|nr:hypothetical protein [Verrucomicrobiota bacterium]